MSLKKKTQKKNRKIKRFKHSLKAKTSPKEKQKAESQPPKTIENKKDKEQEPGYTETIFVYQDNCEAEENALSKRLDIILDDANESTKADKTDKSLQNETPPKENFSSPETSNGLKDLEANLEAEFGNTLLNQDDKTSKV